MYQSEIKSLKNDFQKFTKAITEKMDTVTKELKKLSLNSGSLPGSVAPPVAAFWNTTKPSKSPVKKLHAVDCTSGVVQEQPRVIAFWGKLSPLSNFFNSPVWIEERKFLTSEHAYQYGKASENDQEDLAEEIFNAPTPAAAKHLGDKVILKSETSQWLVKARELMHAVCMKKFEQNGDARDYLLNTGNNTLAEASRSDRVWGCGLPLTDPRIYQKNSWQGANLLGQVLENVRDELRTNKSAKESVLLAPVLAKSSEWNALPVADHAWITYGNAGAPKPKLSYTDVLAKPGT